MPFGEEILRANQGNDSVRNKFTGYQRDEETKLDYAKARMFGSGLGRFTSPDDFLNDTQPEIPQKWNLYVYVSNNPLKYIDPTGEIEFNADGTVRTEERKANGTTEFKIGDKTYVRYDVIKGKDGK
jgi:RHS repeat-associated protein